MSELVQYRVSDSLLIKVVGVTGLESVPTEAPSALTPQLTNNLISILDGQSNTS